MKNFKIASMLFYIVAIIFYVVAIITLASGNKEFPSVAWLCIGSSFLCFGSVFYTKSKHNDNKDPEGSEEK